MSKFLNFLNKKQFRLYILNLNEVTWSDNLT